MSELNSGLVIGKAQPFSADAVYTVSVTIDGVKYGLIVAKQTAPNGIKCLAGHDILRSANPDFNFYPLIADAINECENCSAAQ